ncbi:hypothetical protein RHS03_00680, partial [Rhizoctonia solani]
MNEQDGPVSKSNISNLEVPPEQLLVPGPSSAPLSPEVQHVPFFGASPGGRVTLTFPSRNSPYPASSPRPARYETTTPVSELPAGDGNQSIPEKTAPLRLITDESLALLLDSNTRDFDHQTSSDPSGNNIEAWIEASKQTIIDVNNKKQPVPEGDGKSCDESGSATRR